MKLKYQQRWFWQSIKDVGQVDFFSVHIKMCGIFHRNLNREGLERRLAVFGSLMNV